MLILMTMLALLAGLAPAEEANNPALITGTLTVPERIGITTARFDRHKQGKATVAPASETAKSNITFGI
jgi:hypothetical protein